MKISEKRQPMINDLESNIYYSKPSFFTLLNRAKKKENNNCHIKYYLYTVLTIFMITFFISGLVLMLLSEKRTINYEKEIKNPTSVINYNNTSNLLANKTKCSDSINIIQINYDFNNLTNCNLYKCVQNITNEYIFNQTIYFYENTCTFNYKNIPTKYDNILYVGIPLFVVSLIYIFFILIVKKFN
jgi:hypothetical protein